ncbi:30S ribosomal protein S17 [Candidatus Woesearchaeota archaeon]|nr:30S ribosomal protein S17 [Candidatus Woesearchaeota archaeon]
MKNEQCDDKKCPVHGHVTLKRESFTGIVIKKDANRSATIEWERQHYVKKYERYELRRSRIHVHNPACINAKIGDMVKVMKTRPLSKTKTFAIVTIVGDKK